MRVRTRLKGIERQHKERRGLRRLNDNKRHGVKQSKYTLLKRRNFLIKIMDMEKKELKKVYSKNERIKWLSQNEVTRVFNDAVKRDIAKKQERGLPVARYDKELKRAYLENADGAKEYI
jgi:hypothetical protein